MDFLFNLDDFSGDNMKQNPSDKFLGFKYTSLFLALIFIIFNPKRDVPVFHTDYPAV